VPRTVPKAMMVLPARPTGARLTKRIVISRKPTGITAAASWMGIKAILRLGSKPIRTRATALQVMAEAITAPMKPVTVRIRLLHGWGIRSTPTDRVMCLPSREVMAPPRQVSHSTRW
jgi:hypothetical protein